MLNEPVPAYTGAAIRELVSARWLPRLRQFRPQLVLVSAGFDAHREDDIGRMGLVESDFAWITEQLVQLAGEHGAGVVSCLEGATTCRRWGAAPRPTYARWRASESHAQVPSVFTRIPNLGEANVDYL